MGETAQGHSGPLCTIFAPSQGYVIISTLKKKKEINQMWGGQWNADYNKLTVLKINHKKTNQTKINQITTMEEIGRSGHK